MAVLRTDIERALNELISQEEGMRFQGLAVVLGKLRWLELIAHPRKKDFGLDAYAPASETPERVGKGLAASITPSLSKVSDDAKRAKNQYPALTTLLFVTPAKVGNSERIRWAEAIRKDHDLELLVIEREEIITLMMMPGNASLCANFLHLPVDAEPDVADLIGRTRRAADGVTRNWATKLKGHPLIDLTAVRLEPNGGDSAEVLSLERIDQALSQSGRIVLEGPAGRGKTTTLIQIAQRDRTPGIRFIVDLPRWTASGRNILEYIAGMPAFRAAGLTLPDLVRVQQAEPFLFLLNGWNEIAESSSPQANGALRELERDFPSAGIVVATRMHHLTPPLPGALRLRLLRVPPAQRADYLAARLGVETAAKLRAGIDADPSLDELTRTPLILAEVASLFEAGAKFPATKFGVLAQVLRLHERRDEHENSLQAAPILGQQTAHLKALATEMTRRGGVALSDADARAVVASVAGDLVAGGQIDRIGAPALLVTLTAHHVLERVDYPETAYQFEHQQLQEYCAALDVRAQLLELPEDDQDATDRFTADYVNEPAWAEPLRMVAETFAEQTGDDRTDNRNLRAGQNLMAMALEVDIVFAGELARLCGAAVWKEVGAVVAERFRAAYALPVEQFRKYAVAAMLATGADQFHDIILPLLSAHDRRTRLTTYWLWPDIQLSSLGPNWREQARGWREEARTDFVSELLHHRVDDLIVSFAVEDESVAVKKAAISSLVWTGSDDALIPIIESMNVQDFEDIDCNNADSIPPDLKSKTIAAKWKLIEKTTDYLTRLRAGLDLIQLGEPSLAGAIKDAMAGLPDGYVHEYVSDLRSALDYLQTTDLVWVTEWVVEQIAKGLLYGNEDWLPSAFVVPDDVLETNLNRLETEDLKNSRTESMIVVIAARADADLAARVFAKLRELRRRVDAEPGQQHEFEWQVMRQLKALLRAFPDDDVAAGILSSVTSGDPLDIKVATELLSTVARPDAEPLCVADGALGECLRTYLKSSVDLVLRQDDFTGMEKANLASSIAQVGIPEDMADLMTLIHADIQRVRRGRAARAAGDDGPIANGAVMSYAGWHIAAVQNLDSAGADQVLIDLLCEPEYSTDAAAAMTRDFLPKPDGIFHRKFRYDLMWAARESCTPPVGDAARRTRFAAALNSAIERLREQSEDDKPAAFQAKLATALAAIDGRSSAGAVLGAIAVPEQWGEHACLDAAERLLMAGVVLPTTVVFALVDAILARVHNAMQESDRHLLYRVLALCPFVDDPAAGIGRIRDMVGQRRIRGYELRDVITALVSRS